MPGATDAKLAALQQRTYPDLAPLRLEAAPADAFVRARDAAKAMGWTIVAEDAARASRPMTGRDASVLLTTSSSG